MGLASGIVQAVQAGVEKAHATTVEAVQVRVGTLSGVVPEALSACWPIAAAGTVVEGARLELEIEQAVVWCPKCEAEQPIDEFFALACPVCRTPTGQILRGSDLTVLSADLE